MFGCGRLVVSVVAPIVPAMPERWSRSSSVLWGKSNAGGSMNLLVQHLLDTAAVAELVWDRYLARAVRDAVDAACGGGGRSLFVLVCGLHDVGKATPAFQMKDEGLARRVHSVGLTWRSLGAVDRRWHHTLAGARILTRVLTEVGWSRSAIHWVVPLVSGHHGVIPPVGDYRQEPPFGHGDRMWVAAQLDLVLVVANELSIDLAGVCPRVVPSRALQLALAGGVVMADWIASSEHHFPGVADIDDAGIAGARRRAEQGWTRLGLAGGWRSRSGVPEGVHLVQARFGRRPRPVQVAAVDVVSTLAAVGLVLVEAPMGEGKTEAALAAVEVLADRFGADGVFVGMPTQATSDAMFARVVDWAQRLDPGTSVGLLHGKRRFNRQWRDLFEVQRRTRFRGIDDLDEHGCPAAYGDGLPECSGGEAGAGLAPSQWLLGPKRGLLMPVTVGTIDQLLLAATRTRHVMLRHLGLVGKVVVLDEVHAYDVYMMQFLTEALRWLGDAGVPVVLLSATLPPAMRAELTEAYLQGVLRVRDVELPVGLHDEGYPAVRAVTVTDRVPVVRSCVTASWRSPLAVAVEVVEERPDEGPERVAELVHVALGEGGCALVVRNTVARAQRTYQALRAAFAGQDMEVVLLHARLIVGDRLTRTERVLNYLGAPGGVEDAGRTRRMVVVATQLAEQSFDVDVDLLVTDLAPIDLLLQRVGRLHRHMRGPGSRPARVADPRVVVVGMAGGSAQAPVFPAGCRKVYGFWPLLRSAALVREGAGAWSVPAQVPELVARAYGPDPIEPSAWAGAAADAKTKWCAAQQERARNADRFVLAGRDKLHLRDLAGLHYLDAGNLPDEDAASAMVRDGGKSIEVILLRRHGELRYTLDGRSLGPADTAVSDPTVAEAVMLSSLRLPAKLVEAAERDLGPLRECGADAWLGRARVLELDDEATAVIGGFRLTYDPDLGLLDESIR